MKTLEIRNKLTHAMVALSSEPSAPAWATAGVYFALKILLDKRSTFYCNSSHRSNKCVRCAEIAAIQKVQR
jgi:hypothetical protein